MSALIAAPVAEKLAALIPRLASEYDGEVVSTVRAIRRVLHKHGCDLHDLARSLIEPPAPPQREPPPAQAEHEDERHTAKPHVVMCDECLDRLDFFNTRESNFIFNCNEILDGGNRLSPKQAAWLERLHAQLLTGWRKRAS